MPSVACANGRGSGGGDNECVTSEGEEAKRGKWKINPPVRSHLTLESPRHVIKGEAGLRGRKGEWTKGRSEGGGEIGIEGGKG